MPATPQSEPEPALRYQQAERQVLERIQSGEFVPGARLPSLRVLGLRLGLSIATVNHAYLELERKGVVEARPRSGYFVRPGWRGLPAPRPAAPPCDGPREVARSGLIRTVLAALGDPRLAPLGVVCPGPELLPAADLARILSRLVREAPGRALGYSPIAGMPELRRELAYRRQALGEEADEAGIVCTAGALEALYFSLRVTTRPGDAVAIQSPAYYCFLQLLETLGLRAVEVPSRPGAGVDPADLDAVLRRRQVAACVFTANFNNPDGSLMPEEAKAEAVRLTAARDIPLIEDDVYGDTHFGPRRPGTFKAHDRKGLVLSCSSFSKTLCPGWRVGWMAPGRFLDAALTVRSATNVSTAAPMQWAVAEYLRSGRYERHLRRLRAALERQMQGLRAAVAESFPPGTRATDPSGGGHLWVELPPGVDGVDLFYRARAAGVGIAPGSVFSTQEQFANFIRLGSGGGWSPELREAVKTLGRLAGENIAA
jgi:DNA-binding transcriptional MocR family regulator